MFTGAEIVTVLEDLQITHVVWLPDSTLGRWEGSLEDSPRLRLVRVCREGEAWTLAAGLLIGGQRPLVMMQSTGLFESGDALRNVLFDLRIPLFVLVGVRNWLHPDSPDSARRFLQPQVKMWGFDSVLISSAAEKPKLADHYEACQTAGRAGVALLAEGNG